MTSWAGEFSVLDEDEEEIDPLWEKLIYKRWKDLAQQTDWRTNIHPQFDCLDPSDDFPSHRQVESSPIAICSIDADDDSHWGVYEKRYPSETPERISEDSESIIEDPPVHNNEPNQSKRHPSETELEDSEGIVENAIDDPAQSTNDLEESGGMVPEISDRSTDKSMSDIEDSTIEENKSSDEDNFIAEDVHAVIEPVQERNMVEDDEEMDLSARDSFSSETTPDFYVKEDVPILQNASEVPDDASNEEHGSGRKLSFSLSLEIPPSKEDEIMRITNSWKEMKEELIEAPAPIITIKVSDLNEDTHRIIVRPRRTLNNIYEQESDGYSDSDLISETTVGTDAFSPDPEDSPTSSPKPVVRLRRNSSVVSIPFAADSPRSNQSDSTAGSPNVFPLTLSNSSINSDCDENQNVRSGGIFMRNDSEDSVPKAAIEDAQFESKASESPNPTITIINLDSDTKSNDSGSDNLKILTTILITNFDPGENNLDAPPDLSHDFKFVDKKNGDDIEKETNNLTKEDTLAQAPTIDLAPKHQVSDSLQEEIISDADNSDENIEVSEMEDDGSDRAMTFIDHVNDLNKKKETLPILKEDFASNGEDVNLNSDDFVPIHSVATLEKAFYLVDDDRSGTINLKEFIVSHRDPNIKHELNELLGGDHFTLQMFQSVDDDNSNTITLDEFTQWAQKNWVRKKEIGNIDDDAIEEENVKQRQESLKDVLTNLEMIDGPLKLENLNSEIVPNDDGTIPLFSDRRLEEAFQLCDSDGNGSITLREFVQSNRNSSDTKQKLEELLGGDFFSMKMFESVDVDGSREIDIDEFKEWARRNWIQKDTGDVVLQVDDDEIQLQKEHDIDDANLGSIDDEVIQEKPLKEAKNVAFIDDSSEEYIAPNKDGTIPLFSDKRLEEAFNLCDSDRNGSITLREFVQSNRNSSDTKQKLSELLGGDFFSMKMFDSIDADGSRAIEIDEFKMWAKQNWVQKDAYGLALHVESKEMHLQKEDIRDANIDAVNEVLVREGMNGLDEDHELGKAIEVGGDEMPSEQPELKSGMSKLEEDHELHEILRIYTHDLNCEVTIQELGLNHREFWFLAGKEGEVSDMLYDRFHNHTRKDLKLLETTLTTIAEKRKHPQKESFPCRFSKEMLAELFQACDLDGGGSITLREFIQGKKHVPAHILSEVGLDFFSMSTFQGANRNGSREVGLDNLLEYAKEKWPV